MRTARVHRRLEKIIVISIRARASVRGRGNAPVQQQQQQQLLTYGGECECRSITGRSIFVIVPRRFARTVRHSRVARSAGDAAARSVTNGRAMVDGRACERRRTDALCAVRTSRQSSELGRPRRVPSTVKFAVTKRKTEN